MESNFDREKLKQAVAKVSKGANELNAVALGMLQDITKNKSQEELINIGKTIKDFGLSEKLSKFNSEIDKITGSVKK